MFSLSTFQVRSLKVTVPRTISQLRNFSRTTSNFQSTTSVLKVVIV